MAFLQAHLLTLILFSPLAGAVLLLLVPRERLQAIRWVALLVSLIPLGLALFLWFAYQPGVQGYQFVEQAIWYEAIGSSYHLGVDGISVPMVLLTTLLTPLAILISWSMKCVLRRLCRSIKKVGSESRAHLQKSFFVLRR